MLGQCQQHRTTSIMPACNLTPLCGSSESLSHCPTVSLYSAMFQQEFSGRLYPRVSDDHSLTHSTQCHIRGSEQHNAYSHITLSGLTSTQMLGNGLTPVSPASVQRFTATQQHRWGLLCHLMLASTGCTLIW